MVEREPEPEIETERADKKWGEGRDQKLPLLERDENGRTQAGR